MYLSLKLNLDSECLPTLLFCRFLVKLGSKRGVRLGLDIKRLDVCGFGSDPRTRATSLHVEDPCLPEGKPGRNVQC